ncbi:kinesin-like protein KIF20B [Neosynchiropus ocellatus]
MMQSCLSWKPERVGPVDVDDIKRNLLEDFSAQTENLQVYLRVRPLTSAERESGETEDCVTIESPETVVLKPPRSSLHNRQSERALLQTAQRFTFTQVFGPDASQRRVFDGSVRGLVRQVLDGSNSLVFTYGVTNAGKTFTFLGPDHDGGLLPRSLSVIFNSLAGRLYSRCDLKPQRCRDFSRLTHEQQTSEMTQKKNLLRLCKESDKSVSWSKSTFLDGSSVCSDSINSIPDDSFTVDDGSHIQFSIWISFCEIYNDNVHDLLDQVPIGQKRQFLRLSQDVKGNSYIKDLRWVQVNNSEEAYRLMKVGKKNQSISATRLNQESSRSHSIFSIRIMRVDHIGVPRVVGISELVLCDLAGSERCSRTNNTGKRLKEAGNINNSLLTLGKCLQSLRLNSQNKFQHHVPFRESKLTHFLQFFFSGASRVTMVVNINQNSSNVDETLNVLKFSALAQKVVMVNSRPVVVDPVISGPELSLNMIEAQKNVARHGRKSSLIAWETSLEDVLEDVDEDGEEEEEEFEESEVEGTVLEAEEEVEEEEGEEDRTMEVDKEVEKQGALRLLLEAQIREEVCAEFRDIFTKMEKDFSDRLEKEREILEQRAEKRVEILKNLVTKTMGVDTVNTNQLQGDQADQWEGFIHSMSRDLEKIRADAESVHQCLAQPTQAAELEALRLEKQQSHDQLQEANENLQLQRNKLSGLEVICEQKNEQIKQLEDEMKTTLERAERDRGQVDMLKAKLLELEKSCSCARFGAEDHRDLTDQDLNDRNLRDRKRQRLTETDDGQCPAKKSETDCVKCAASWSSLEREQRETARLTRENKAAVDGMFQLQTQVKSLDEEVQKLTGRCTSQSEELQEVLARNQELQTQLEKGEGPGVFHSTIKQLKLESEAALESSIQKSQHIQQLQQQKDQLEARLTLSETCCNQLSEDVRGLKEELERRDNELRKREEQRQMREDELQRQEEQRQATEEELERGKEQRLVMEEELKKMKEKLAASEAQGQVRVSELQKWEEQLQRREEEVKRREEQQEMAEKEQQSEENQQSITEELLEMDAEEKDQLLQKHETSKVGEEEPGKLESQKIEEELVEEQKSPAKMQSKFSVVEELKEELLKFKERKEQCQREKTELRSQAVLRPVRHDFQTDQNIPPGTESACDGRKNLRTTARKRKSYEVEALQSSENKRNRGRGIDAAGSSGKSVLGRLANTAPKQRRGRRKLFKAGVSSPLSISPVIVTAEEEKESAHAIVKRQLRAKGQRK